MQAKITNILTYTLRLLFYESLYVYTNFKLNRRYASQNCSYLIKIICKINLFVKIELLCYRFKSKYELFCYKLKKF